MDTPPSGREICDTDISKSQDKKKKEKSLLFYECNQGDKQLWGKRQQFFYFYFQCKRSSGTILWMYRLKCVFIDMADYRPTKEYT